ncbi:hypothetical protein [Nocardiopsis kunsanensis]|uniref:hypothetical protein n=1 Tax=Nocardiopsis kunsanensis TaxID=141693 RepID=UPI0012689ABE|nr:hypothetical protein [Nocardiopsis kunsanensis]
MTAFHPVFEDPVNVLTVVGAVFGSTRTAVEQRLSGSAAEALRKRGSERAQRGAGFHLGGRAGPLREEEQGWARSRSSQLT